MKVSSIILAIFMMAISLPAMAECKDFYTPLQCANLKLAYDMGKQDDIQNLMAGIMLRETSAGASKSLVGERDKAPLYRSYGLMQVQIKTAKDIVDLYPSLWPGKHTNKEWIHKLLHDSKFNVTIAYYYLEWLKQKGLNWREMITAYNRGIAGYKEVDSNTYEYTVWVINKVVKFQTKKIFLVSHSEAK